MLGDHHRPIEGDLLEDRADPVSEAARGHLGTSTSLPSRLRYVTVAIPVVCVGMFPIVVILSHFV